MSIKKLTSWEAWGFGLLGAIKGAIVTSVLSYAGTQTFGLDMKWRQFAVVIGSAALVQGFMYIQKSPMPFEVTEETTTTETTATATTTTTTEAKQTDPQPPV